MSNEYNLDNMPNITDIVEEADLQPPTQKFDDFIDTPLYWVGWEARSGNDGDYYVITVYDPSTGEEALITSGANSIRRAIVAAERAGYDGFQARVRKTGRKYTVHSA